MSTTNNTPAGLLPFSWEEAQKRPDAVVTRDGRSVKLAGYNPDADKEQRIIGWIENQYRAWFSCGNHMFPDIEREGDLFLKPEVREIYFNVYENRLGGDAGSIEECKESRDMDAIAIVMIATGGKDISTPQIVHRYNQPAQ